MRGAYLPEKLTLNDTNFKIKMIIAAVLRRIRTAALDEEARRWYYLMDKRKRKYLHARTFRNDKTRLFRVQYAVRILLLPRRSEFAQPG